MRNKQFNYSKIQGHEHNGVDTLQINDNNVANGNKYVTIFNSIISETFSFKTHKNAKDITMYGFAANNAGGGGATLKAIVNGYASFGRTFGIQGTTTFTTIPLVGQAMCQMSNSMYLDTTTLGNSKVNTSTEFLGYVKDPTVEVATVKILSNNDGEITLQVVLAAGWQIWGSLIIN